jgi:pectin methylesterase-like acyl-CoA thioesterase
MVRIPVKRLSLALIAGVMLSGCGSIEPWVKPYERERLADPIMSFSPNPVSSSYLDHVYESREGAKGATGAVGGGCGCN